MHKLIAFLSVLLILFLSGCDLFNDAEEEDVNTDIPDDPTEISVPEPKLNNIRPTAVFSQSAVSGDRVEVNMTGIINPNTGQAITLDYLNNLYLKEDGVVKGLKLTKVDSENILAADIVFVVDNSGSMDEEANAVASSIIEFADSLQSSGLDVSFACVGYNGWVNGAINFTTASALGDYLNQYNGTSRTSHYGGPDAEQLQTDAYNHSGTWDENGVVAVFFANEYFNWRTNSQRIFINFTDEPTQPGGDYDWSTERCCDLLGQAATIHTVWSNSYSDTSNAYSWSTLYSERPWDLSKCSGGTVIQVSYNASDLNLSRLPVTGALTNSYKVEFVTSDANGTHDVEITVITTTADGRTTYRGIRYQ